MTGEVAAALSDDPAVGAQDLAVNPDAIRSGEEGDGVGDVFRPAEPLERGKFGQMIVAESGAIIDYILRRYGKGRLQPAVSDPKFDDYVHWMHYAEGSAMPALIVRINVARAGDAAKGLLPRLDGEIALQLAYINGALEGRPYILGQDLTAADIQLSFVGELAAGFFGISDYPHVESWVKRFQQRSAYQAALARGGPYRFAS